MLALRRVPYLKGELMNKNIAAIVLLLAAGCVGRFDPETVDKRDAGTAANPMVGETLVPPMDPKRKVNEQDCSRPVDTSGGNLMCKELTAAERRARDAEEERQARAKAEAERRAAAERERAERERLERERLAREEAARKAREAEEAERRRLAEAAALKARQESERLEREQAELRARERAEQEKREAAERAEREKREAAERERQRLEQEWLAGRAMLENFVATYGKAPKFKGVSGQINTFLEKTR